MAANANGSTRKQPPASVSGEGWSARILGDDELLRPDHCALVLKCGRTLVYDLMASGYLKSVTVGADRRVRVGDLKEYIRAQEKKHGKP